MAHKDDVFLMRPVERDLRLDMWRGLGLWMVFLDHVPNDIVAWLTLRNYGFSDAAEFFVFISGYLAGFIYGPIIAGNKFLAATKRLWKRNSRAKASEGACNAGTGKNRGGCAGCGGRVG